MGGDAALGAIPGRGRSFNPRPRMGGDLPDFHCSR